MKCCRSTIILILFVLLGMACRREGSHLPEDSRRNAPETNKSLLDVNKYLVEKDKKLIEAYIDRMEWEMQADSAGFWYHIVEHGKGVKAEVGNTISYEYSVSLMDGTVCYTSAEEGLGTFKIGQGGVETGLEYGVLKLHEGDSARFIFPPHLAHGLIGDNKCIPARSIIIYHLRVSSIIK